MVDGYGVRSVVVRSPFLVARQRAMVETGLPHQWRMCEETGRVENFRRAARRESDGHQGFCYNDSDLYKWAEAAAYAVLTDPSGSVRRELAEFAGLVEAAQLESGYLDTYFQLGRMDQQWKSLTSKHEMYCLGHLIEAGVACASVEPRLLTAARRAADHVASVFGPQRRLGACGHEEIELAMCALSDCVGNSEYRSLARWMTERRGHRPSPFESEMANPEARELATGYARLVEPHGVYEGSYFQDDRPLAEQTAPVGHAVRAMYQYCGALDADPAAWLPALRLIWNEMIRSRIYVTGGIGSAPGIEGFGPPFDLPNRGAYSETCAAVGLVFWAARMSRATGESRYADWLERALVNAVLSGVSLSGDRYFYDNPLASVGDKERRPWFDCACCPPNLARLLLSVGRYLVWADDRSVTIDVGAEMSFEAWPSGVRTVVEVRSDWPWGGSVSVVVRPERTVWFALRLRVPDWATGVDAGFGSESGLEVGGWIEVKREWTGGEELQVNFGRRPGWVSADPRVSDTTGKVCLSDGPVVYCLEEADLGAPVSMFHADVEGRLAPDPAGSDEVRGLLVTGSLALPQPGGGLYSSLSDRHQVAKETRFVPYFSWANRGLGSMAVWVNGS
ncbi:MAG: glycoside hydrolase family 127 protein [Fimbriimonadaceae bacterium]|nr:glycoside hydrolase family 127 protein [Fimbriimonadaceae bacterium]QYK58793.1 MAG: glycoside hydrolase family 127 protein [Fimbriimonadaceae bacterium]